MSERHGLLPATATLVGVGAVNRSDIVEFTPTSTGNNTAGTFTLFFRGLGAGLDTSAEDIDAIGFAPNGALLVSTTDSPSVTCGPPVCPGLANEDLLVYTGAALGEGTTNSWNIYFDGSDVALTDGSEDVNGTDINGANGDIYLTTLGVFSVSGVSGDGTDIFVCAPGSTGATTTCAYRPFFDGSANGLTGDVDRLGATSNAATVTVYVPVAIDDSYTATANTNATQTISRGTSIGVLAKDLPINRAGRTVALVSGPTRTGGTGTAAMALTLNANGSFSLSLMAPASATTGALWRQEKRGVYEFTYTMTLNAVTTAPATATNTVQ